MWFSVVKIIMIKPVKPVFPTKNKQNNSMYDPYKTGCTRPDKKENKTCKNKSKLTTQEKRAICTQNGKTDVDISMISSCTNHSINECENNCARYSSCQTIAYANGIIKTYELEHSFGSILNSKT